ncbi:delta-type opioid receptor-like [Patiria miniata]|uniref:G-protein coupled receptors family 1 profile domain-containing protein n=1 Tax=Patiria miniata TaxID=46514 RepID=A0A914B2C9_PATMI|nr:delta-type opioid receptor-like [Patiria miniata]
MKYRAYSILKILDMNSTKEDGHGSEFGSLITTLTVITSFLSLLGNGTVITVMLARRRVFSSFTNRLILHQSTIDAINGLMFLLLRIVKSLNLVVSKENNFYDQLVCRVLASDVLLWCGYVTSTYNLVLISLERFMAICYPVKHRKMVNKHKLKIVIGVLWAISFVYNLPLLFLNAPSEGRCQITAAELNSQFLLGVVAFLIEYLAPLSIIVFVYGAIFIKLKTRRDDSHNFRNQAKKNVLVTLLMISVLFVVCWTPVECGTVMLFSRDFDDDVPVVMAAMSLLISFNMIVNPIVYCFMYKQFRDQLKDVVLKRLRRNQVQSDELQVPRHMPDPIVVIPRDSLAMAHL